MRSFSEQSGQEALVSAAALFARLGRESPALISMGNMAAALCMGDAAGACRHYHRAYGEMLRSQARRVSGDMWRDELMCAVIQRPHPFGAGAAMGIRDEAARCAMKERLGVLGALSGMSTETVAAMVQSRPRNPRRDGISAKSAALWSGGAMPQKRAAEPEEDMLSELPLAFSQWKYGTAGLTDSWESDEALEEIYLRLMETEDWPSLIEDLWNFFASYGTGDFLRCRAFRARGGTLEPLPERITAPLIPVSLYERQQSRLMENAISFMRGERSETVLLAGPDGVGKTARVLSLLQELPQVRLVLAAAGDAEGLPDIIEILAAQPYRFILLLDDADPEGPELRRFCSRMLGLAALPGNVMLCGTSNTSGGFFTETLAFPYPTLDEFSALVREILEEDGAYADRQTIRNAAVDYQVDVREKLTFTGALALARRLKSLGKR